MRIKEMDEMLALLLPGVRRLAPRRIVTPDGYFPPDYYYANHVAAIVEQNMGRPCTETAAASLLVANELDRHGWPTYFVTHPFILAMEASNLPDLKLADLRFPFSGMLFALPLGYQQQLGYKFGFVAIARVNAGRAAPTRELLRAHIAGLGCEKDMVICHIMMIGKKTGGIVYSSFSPTDLMLSVFMKDRPFKRDDSSEDGLRWLASMNPDAAKEVGRCVREESPPKDEEEAVVNRLSTLAVKLTLTMSAARSLVEHGAQVRKERIKHGAVKKDALWAPSWIGKAYQLKSSHGDGTGTHAPPRVHWRKGHWHTVLHGKQRSKRRVDWFEPVLVNPPKEESQATE